MLVDDLRGAFNALYTDAQPLADELEPVGIGREPA